MTRNETQIEFTGHRFETTQHIFTLILPGLFNLSRNDNPAASHEIIRDSPEFKKKID